MLLRWLISKLRVCNAKCEKNKLSGKKGWWSKCIQILLKKERHEIRGRESEEMRWSRILCAKKPWGNSFQLPVVICNSKPARGQVYHRHKVPRLPRCFCQPIPAKRVVSEVRSADRPSSWRFMQISRCSFFCWKRLLPLLLHDKISHLYLGIFSFFTKREREKERKRWFVNCLQIYGKKKKRIFTFSHCMPVLNI